MGTGFYILAILGCGDGATMCEQVAREETVFASEAACMARSDDALIRESDQPYPMLMAQCHSVDRQVASYWGNGEG